MSMLNVILILGCLTVPSLCVEHESEIGKAYSILGLALVIPHYIVFKKHLRLLDLLQLVFLFGLSGQTFLSELAYSWVSFIPNYWKYNGVESEYLDIAGSLLGFGTCLVIAITLAWVVTMGLRACNQTNTTFGEVFLWFKGLIRWIYLGLVSSSVATIINWTQSQSSSTLGKGLIAPSVVLAICLIFPIWQLVARRVHQQSIHSSTSKWFDATLDFLSWMRLFVVGGLIPIRVLMDANWISIPIYVVICVYAITFMVVQAWDNLVERIVFFITQAVIITLYTLQKFFLNVVRPYNIEFYLVTIALGIETIYELYKYIRRCQARKSHNKIQNKDTQIMPVKSRQQFLQPTSIQMKTREDRSHLVSQENMARPDNIPKKGGKKTSPKKL